MISTRRCHIAYIHVYNEITVKPLSTASYFKKLWYWLTFTVAWLNCFRQLFGQLIQNMWENLMKNMLAFVMLPKVDIYLILYSKHNCRHSRKQLPIQNPFLFIYSKIINKQSTIPSLQTLCILCWLTFQLTSAMVLTTFLYLFNFKFLFYLKLYVNNNWKY